MKYGILSKQREDPAYNTDYILQDTEYSTDCYPFDKTQQMPL